MITARGICSKILSIGSVQLSSSAAVLYSSLCTCFLLCTPTAAAGTNGIVVTTASPMHIGLLPLPAG
jgi:hypothetical protein